MTHKIAILGAGNLGFSIAKGLVNSGINHSRLVLSEKNSERRKMLESEGFVVTESNITAIDGAGLVMVVVKPWQIQGLLEEIKDSLDKDNQVLLSCVTGATSERVFEALGYEMPLFRVMPNTGIAVQESMSCISTFHTTEEQNAEIKELFGHLGQVLFLPEDQMAAATALAGCGIAFALRFIRAAIQGGVEIGFRAEDANLMASQIALGAAKLIIENNSHPESEIDKVTTPKGITITGLNEMEHVGFSSSIIKGILASYNKIFDQE